MPLLRSLQDDFRRAVLAGEYKPLLALIAEDGIAAQERLGVYVNNIFASLTEVLGDTFPAVCRLVDARFFAFAAHEFICRHPPARAVLGEYGARFPDFLAAFPPCGGLVYLADVARLEWKMSVASRAVEMPPISPDTIAAIAPGDTPRLRLRLDPACGYLASPWPVDRIWRASRREPEGEGVIDLAAGGVRLEVRRRGEDVVLRALDAGTYAFRAALAEAATLESATALALAADAGFDVVRGFADLFREGTVVAASLAGTVA
jgi:hypothetical protein